MPTTQSGIKIDESKYKNGTISIMKTPMTRFGVLYFPTFDKKENDRTLCAYKVNAYSTIDEAKKYGIEIADKYLKSIKKKKDRSMERQTTIWEQGIIVPLSNQNPRKTQQLYTSRHLLGQQQNEYLRDVFLVMSRQLLGQSTPAGYLLAGVFLLKYLEVNMNQYLGIGNLTREPQLTTKDGTTYCNFTVAVNNRHNDTSFVDVVAYNKQAEACAKHLMKGSKVCFRGIAEPRAYLDKDGNPHAVLKVKIREIDFLAKTKPRTDQLDENVSVDATE